MKEKRKQLNTKQKTLGLFLAVSFLFILFSFVKTAEAQVHIGARDRTPIPGYGGAGGNQKVGTLITPDVTLGIFSVESEISPATPTVAYLYNATSGGDTLVSLIATTSVNSYGIGYFSDTIINAGQYYYILFDQAGTNWSHGIAVKDDSGADPLAATSSQNITFSAGWNVAKTTNARYQLKTIWISETTGTSTRITSVDSPVNGEEQLTQITDFIFQTYSGYEFYDLAGIQYVNVYTFENNNFLESYVSGLNQNVTVSLLNFDLESDSMFQWRAVLRDSTGNNPDIYSEWRFLTTGIGFESNYRSLISLITPGNGWCDLATTSDTWFYQKVDAVMSGICRLGEVLVRPSTSTLGLINNQWLEFKKIFPFSLAFSLMNTIKNPVAPTQQTAYIPFSWSSNSTGIAISSTTLTSVIGQSNYNLYRTVIGAFIWISLAFIIWRTIA